MNKYFYVLFALFVLVSCSKDDDSNELQPPTAANRLSTGDSAREFLTEEHFSAIVMEVVYVDGQPPEDAALENLKQFINQRCYKSSGVELIKRSIPNPGKEFYTIAQVDSLEKQLRSQYNSGNRLALFVLYLNGSYTSEAQSTEDPDEGVVLGVAYRNTSFVVFKERINEISTTKRLQLESTVLQHEFSHLLGLVNVGTEMQTDHIDPEHGHHCVEENCLMNYRVESGLSFQNGILENQIPQLDAQCLADLQANGGK